MQSQKVYELILKKIDRMADVCSEMFDDNDPELKIELHQILEELDGFEFFLKDNEELKDEISYIKGRFPDAFKG
jgi:hypothetical protein